MLAHDIVKYEDSDPGGYMLFAHGILGTRANWRGIARRFVRARPEWGAILVDLREHGDSLGRPAPHTLSAAANDLAELERSLSLDVHGALGHSFGGKVVLEWVRERGGHAEVWTIDSAPGPTSEQGIAGEVIACLTRLPRQWPSKEAFVEAVVAAGQPEGIAQWLAMNLRNEQDGTRVFGPDLEAIRAMITDYANTDLWPILESPPSASTIHAVIGGQSPMYSNDDLERIHALSANDPAIRVHVIERAGHWVHVDAAAELVALLTSEVGAPP